MDFSSLQTLFPLLLPVPIALIAGILRQDKFPVLANEIISQSIIFLVALLSFLLGIGGHLTGNVQVDFLALVAYCGWLSNTAPFKPLHVYLQSNVLSLGLSEASKIEQTTIADVKASVDGLIAFLGNAGVGQQAPTLHQQAHVAQAVQQVPFPAQAPIPYQPQAWTAPGLQAMPTPPKG